MLAMIQNEFYTHTVYRSFRFLIHHDGQAQYGDDCTQRKSTWLDDDR